MKGILAIALLAISGLARAGEGEIWGVMTLWSYHEHRGESYNQDNYGIGFEYGLNGWARAVAGQFRNSDERNSVYGGLQVRSFCSQVLTAEVCPGVTLGAVSGYTGPYDQLYRKVAVPLLTIERRASRLGANINVARTHHTGWVFGLQGKVLY